VILTAFPLFLFFRCPIFCSTSFSPGTSFGLPKPSSPLCAFSSLSSVKSALSLLFLFVPLSFCMLLYSLCFVLFSRIPGGSLLPPVIFVSSLRSLHFGSVLFSRPWRFNPIQGPLFFPLALHLLIFRMAAYFLSGDGPLSLLFPVFFSAFLFLGRLFRDSMFVLFETFFMAESSPSFDPRFDR